MRRPPDAATPARRASGLPRRPGAAAPPRRRQVVVMLKLPRPGRVKTRLARDIGPVAAAWWMRHQATRLLRRLRDPRWQLVLAVAPDAALHDPAWPGDLPRRPQGPGDLGARMGRVFRTAPPGPVCIVGADIPALSRGHIARAFAALAGGRAVLGPAEDGGYWLIGLPGGAPPAGLFDGVRWSSATARADTIATLGPLVPVLTDRLGDVDTAADLARHRPRADCATISPVTPHPARDTRDP